METTKELQWGETHWDNMTGEELLREVQRMYVVIQSQSSIINMIKMANPESPFWGKEGSGGIALEMARQVLQPIEELYGEREPMFSGFYRYARDLLFDISEYEIGYNWAVCDKCGVMLGNRRNDLIGTPCRLGQNDCSGTFRKLEWDDLKPNRD
jgi:hypothetical protein